MKLTATILGAMTMQAICLSIPFLMLALAAAMLSGAITIYLGERS